MKFSGALLALILVSSASAFINQAPAFSRGGVVLSSTPQNQQATGSGVADAYTQALQNQARQQQQRPQQPMQQQRQQPMQQQRPTASRPQTGPAGAGARSSYDASQAVPVQGGSLKTWSLQSTAIQQVQVVLKTEGRPLDADIDLWHGPDNTPHKMRVYVEDGAKRPFSAVVQTPRGPNTVAIRNIGQMEFPLSAYVMPNPNVNVREMASPMNPRGDLIPRTIQGGALKTYPFEPNVQSVQVMLKTDGRPLNARIELLQGPNNNKQVMEIYIEDGADRPFFAVIETPGSGNVVRVVNTATVEFPMSAVVEPYEIGDYGSQDDIVVSGEDGMSFSRDMQW